MYMNLSTSVHAGTNTKLSRVLYLKWYRRVEFNFCSVDGSLKDLLKFLIPLAIFPMKFSLSLAESRLLFRQESRNHGKIELGGRG